MSLDREEILSRLEEGNGARSLAGLDLAGADLSRLDLRGVDLSRADLSAADLRWAILEGADLSASVLRRADARWAILRGANLRQADLGRANLGWADIAGADLTGAEMDGTSLENVNLENTLLGDRRARRPRVAAATAGGAIALPAGLGRAMPLPQVGPMAIAAATLAALGLVWLWGWLFRGAYFDAFDLADAGIVALDQTANLFVGFLEVVGLTLKVLLTTPLVLVAATFVVAVVLSVPLGLSRLAERVLADIERPEIRPVVMGGLFVAFFVVFFLFLPTLQAALGGLVAQALPGDRGLAAVATLFQIGGWLTKLGFLVVLAASVVAAWTFWRWLSHWLVTTDFPTAWRLRYPALNEYLISARESRLFGRHEPLTEQERRRGLGALAGGVLLLATLLTGVGRVYAYLDMCDGGDLPRVQLYTNRAPDPAEVPDDELLCERLLAKTDDDYFVFFPSETTQREADDLTTRRAQVQAIPQGEVVDEQRAVGEANDCATCEGGPTGAEAYLLDPDEIVVEGTILQKTADVLMLDVEAGTAATVNLLPTTALMEAGQPTTPDTLQPGRRVRAYGTLALDGPALDARLVVLLPQDETTALPTPELTVDARQPEAILVSGASWQPGHELQIGIARPGSVVPDWALATVTVLPDGTFSAPIAFRTGMPTGPGYQLVAYDPETRQSQAQPWLEAPPPTATPPPTPRPRPTIGEETPVTPEAAEATPTPAGEATNTPFPGFPGPGGGAGSCDPDEFEFDSGRGFQKEIFVGFGESTAAQTHNFCPRGDIDLMFFRVKAGRWYRVRTSDLAAGVDTVMAVGDLSPDTPCQPGGCWNDDRAALTYESEIVFQALEDDTALVTVDNRGSNFGTEATYQVSVVEFQPEPTPTPTLEATPTRTTTPTATPLPPPKKDPFEPNDRCTSAYKYIGPGTYLATIDRAADEDWYRTSDLVPGDYRLAMKPPKGKDYDLYLYLDSTVGRTDCATVVDFSINQGDELEEITFGVREARSFIIRVFPAYSTEFDPYNYYELSLLPIGPSATPTSTPIPTSTPVPPSPPPPPTPTPTQTVVILIPPTPSTTPTDTFSAARR